MCFMFGVSPTVAWRASHKPLTAVLGFDASRLEVSSFVLKLFQSENLQCNTARGEKQQQAYHRLAFSSCVLLLQNDLSHLITRHTSWCIVLCWIVRIVC